MGKHVPKIIPGDWNTVAYAIAKLDSKLNSGAAPTFFSLTLSGLTASRLAATDASKVLASVDDLTSWITGTTNQVVVVDDSDGTITLSLPQDIHTAATPTFASLTLSGLTATRLMASDGSKGLVSVADLASWIAGTTDHIDIANDGDGSVTVNLGANTQNLLDHFNGTFIEMFDFTISESSGTVTGSLEKQGGGDLTQRFSDGYTILSPKTINLTAFVGTDTAPKKVFVYILQSDKDTLVASNSDWPATEHEKIANLLLRSATTTGTDAGALVNRNWNDHASDTVNQGMITHIEERLRQEPTQWKSGVALTLKDSAGDSLTTGNSSTAVELVSTAGETYQLHKQTFSAFDMYVNAADDVHVVNQPAGDGGSYFTTANLVGSIVSVADGTSIGTNKYFNLIIWGVQNRSGEASHVMVNLPTNQYSTETSAINDDNAFSVFSIPSVFKGEGFLIARLTFRLISGPQWTFIAEEDLRGLVPPTSAGISLTTTDHALLSNLGFASASHTGFQAQGDVLDDLNTLGANAADSEFLVGTAAGVLAWESGDTVRTSLGLSIGSDVQAYDAELASLAGLTYAAASFIKMTGANTFVLRTIGETADDLEGTIDHNNLANTHGAIQPLNSGLTSLAGLSYVAASFVKMTGADTFALRTIGETADDLEGTIDHNNLANTHNLTTDIDHDALTNTHGAIQPLDTELTSLAALSYVSASFIKMTGAGTFALRTIGQTADDLEGAIDHNNLANTHASNIFSTIAVSGQSNVVADSDADTLTLVAGTNITITTDAGADSVTINSSGGGANHDILDGSVHTDSVADAVTRGSIIYGNTTPKWDELVLGAANTFLGSDGTDLSYRTATQTKVSLGLDTGDAVQFASIGINDAGAAYSASYTSVNLSKDTAGTWYPLFLHHKKIAGASGDGNHFQGIFNQNIFDQSGGTIGHLRGIYNSVRHFNGNIGSSGVPRDVYAFYNALQFKGGAGKVWGTVRSDYVAATQLAGHEIVGDFTGFHLDMNSQGTVGGDVIMLYLNEQNGIDFGIYQNGTAMNVLGGPLKVALKTGTTQGNAGAAAGELWADTDDAYTVKLGT